MSVVAIEPPPLKVLHKFTVDEYHRLGEAGILHEDDRIELIEGELIEMPPIGPLHADSASLLVRRLGY